MIIISFDKYDELTEKAASLPAPPLNSYPDMGTIEKLLMEDGSNLGEVLRYYCHPRDKEYLKELNSLLSDMVYLTDEENQGTQKGTQGERGEFDLQRMSTIVENMEFQCDDWYPSIADLQEHPLEASEANAAFLLWLISSKLELTDDEQQAKGYAVKLLQEMVGERP